MNELLQKHGCSNVFTIPDGLRELMSDISREVLREQPSKICDFIANYLSALLVTREHGVMAVKILEDLCDCKPTVSEHLLQVGFEREEAENMAEIIKNEIEGFEPVEGKEKIKETELLKTILKQVPLDEELTVKVCQVARNAYRDYWYRKKLLEQGLKMQPDEPWEIAAQHTLDLYKRTKPSFSELTRATQKIQAAYKGYYVRKCMLKHISPKPKKQGPRVELSGPPIDVAASREIDLGPLIDIKSQVLEDDVNVMFDEHVGESLGLKYDPMKTITHHPSTELQSFDADQRRQSRMMPIKRDAESRTERGATFASAVDVARDVDMEPDNAAEAKISFAHKSQSGMDESSNQVRQIPSQAKSVPSQIGASSKIDTVSLEAKSAMSQIEAKTAASQIEAKSVTSQVEAKSATSQIEAKAATSQIEDTMTATSQIAATEATSRIEAVPSQVKSAAAMETETEATTAKSLVSDAADEVPIEVIQEPIEIPEDIPDDQTEPDSVPMTSLPSSAPMSATTTDVEDAGLTSAEEDDG